MADLRASHWNVALHTPTAARKRNDGLIRSAQMPKRPDSAFVTSQMVNFRWVQPYPSISK